MQKVLFSALLVSALFSACTKYDDPNPNPSETDEISLVMDSYTGLYNVHITRETRDSSGQINSTEVDSIVVLSRADETHLELVQKAVSLDPSQNQGTLYQPSDFYYLTNPNNNSNVYQNLKLYKETPKRLVFISYEGGRTGSLTTIYEGILQ